jgi:hypothetical protein
VKRFVEDVWKRLSSGLPLAFQRVDPADENDVNDKVEALLNTERERLRREHPAVPFALARAVPDHSSERYTAFLEVKYLRGATSPSKASEGVAADLTKYPAAVHVVFVIYDPRRAIKNDEEFKAAFEDVAKNRCTVLIIR